MNKTPRPGQALNQTWPASSNPTLPPTPTADPSGNMIASCLRLAANFLLQSATFFESKNAPLPDLNPSLPAPLFPPLASQAGSAPPPHPSPAPLLPLIMNPFLTVGGGLPSMMPPMPPLLGAGSTATAANRTPTPTGRQKSDASSNTPPSMAPTTCAPSTLC